MRQHRHFIRQWREHRGLTQVQLAERAEITQAQLSRVENGKRLYDEEFLERVAVALNATPADLIMRDPTSPDALWSIHEQLTPAQRVQLVEFAKVMTKTGTNG